MHRFTSMFAAILFISILCLPLSVSAAQEEGVSNINLQGLQKLLAENEGKVVLLNFWHPY